MNINSLDLGCQPIPLELLVVAPLEDSVAARGGAVRPKSLISRGTNPKYPANPPPGVDKHSKNGFAMTFIHLGRRGYQITLWSASWAGRKKWLEKIEGRQLELRDRSLVFETRALSAGYFVGTNRVTCAAPFGKFPCLSVRVWRWELTRPCADNGNRMVYGTDNGVYLSDLRDNAKVPVKVISVPNVTQLDVLEEHGILIVLAGALTSPLLHLHALTSFPLQTKPCRPSSSTTSIRATPSARPSARARSRRTRPSSRRASASTARSSASSSRAPSRARLRRSSRSCTTATRSRRPCASSSKAATRPSASSRYPFFASLMQKRKLMWKSRPGILHPNRVELGALPQVEALRRLHQGVRDRRPRDARHAGPA